MVRKNIFFILALLTILISLGFISAVMVSYGPPTETNRSNLSRTYILVNVTIVSNVTALSNITINLWNASGDFNYSYNNSGDYFLYQNISGLTEGLWYFNATAYNSTQLLNSTNSTYSVTIDITNPLLTIISPAAYSNTTSKVIFVNVTANDTYLYYMNISILNSTGQTVNSTSNTSVGVSKISVSVDGNYTINATAYDFAGNTNRSLRNITIDGVAPTIAFTSPANNTIHIGNITADMDVADVTGGIGTLTVDLYNSSDDLVNTTTSSSSIYYTFSGHAPGTYYINATVNDTIGNINTSATRTFILTDSSLTFNFNGTVKDNNGLVSNNTVVNITMEEMAAGSPPTVIGYISANTNAAGSFNITVPGNAAWMYKPVLRHTNLTENIVDLVGPSVPDFPYSEFSALHDINFYLKQAGTINITAINVSDDRVPFKYQIKDTKLGYPIAYDFTNFVNETIVYVPADRNYSVMIYPYQNLPITFNWNNFSSTTSYNFGAEYPLANLSRYNATTKIVHKQFNTSNTNIRLTGYINVTGIGGWNEFKVAAILLEPGNMVYLQYGVLPYNMSAWDAETDVYILDNATAYYNITVPGPAEPQALLLIATARNGTNHYGGFKNISVNYSTAGAQYNFTKMYGMLGVSSNLSLNNPTSAGSTNMTCKKQSFNILNSTSGAYTGTAHVEATVDYTNYGAMEFTFMEDVAQGAGTFAIPLLNVTGIKEMNIFVAQGAPKRIEKTAAQIVSNNSITISSFNPGDINGALSANQISVSMYISNSTCDVPNPATACLITSSADLTAFNPLSAVIGGGAISFRMGTATGILIHYVNVDLLASGPPDGMFENESGASESSSSFSNAMKFGSNGPTIYDSVFISMPYVEGSTSTTGLNDSLDVNLTIPNFYGQDANGNMNWTTPIWSSSNGTNATLLAANYSHYSTYKSQWQTLMDVNNCTKNQSTFNSTYPCYIDTDNNRIWIRLPHFSGTAPSVSGSLVTATPVNTTGGSTGGTSSSTVTIYNVSESQLTTGYTKELFNNNKISFVYSGASHTLTLKSVSAKQIIVTVMSTLQQKTISIGNETTFDLNGDAINDISVKYVNFSNNKATITIKKIASATTPTPPTPPATTPTTEPTTTPIIGKANSLLWTIVIIIMVVIIGVIIYLSIRNYHSIKTRNINSRIHHSHKNPYRDSVY